MLSLIYVSTANTLVDDPMVRQIAGAAAENNAKHGVTGLLAYNTRNFMQLLEGEGDDVLAIMRAIENDERHANIVYIRQDLRETRECPNWSMRSLMTPLTGIGSAKVFSGLLPTQMEFDTKMLFTSFASSLSASSAAALTEEEEEAFRRQIPESQND